MPTTKKSKKPKKPTYRESIEGKADAVVIAAYKKQVDELKALRKKNREAEAKLKDGIRPAQRFWKKQLSGRWFDGLPKTLQNDLKSTQASATRLLSTRKRSTSSSSDD